MILTESFDIYLGDKDTQICGASQIKCYTAAENALAASDRGKLFRSKCNCLPSCITIEYNVDENRLDLHQESIKSSGEIGK